MNVQLRDRTDVASFAGTNQLANECLKNDAGRDLWAVRRRFPDEAVAVVFIIGIEIAEAEFGIDVPRDLAAERTGDLRCDVRTSPKTADVYLAGQIKRFAEIVPVAGLGLNSREGFFELRSS